MKTENKQKKLGFCIFCRDEIPFCIQFPVCSICGGICSAFERSSTTFGDAYYCHLCGEENYVSRENPICSQCKQKIG